MYSPLVVDVPRRLVGGIRHLLRLVASYSGRTFALFENKGRATS